MKKILLFLFVTILTVPMAFAEETQPKSYSVDFAPNSLIKNVPLTNAKIKLQVYYNGNPKGTVEIQTDANNQFTYGGYKDPKALVFEVVSVENQGDYNAKCTGTLLPGDDQVKIVCKPTGNA